MLQILLISDAATAKSLRQTLKSTRFKGSRVFCVASIQEIAPRNFDLIMTDLKEGITTLFPLFELYPHTPILYIGNKGRLAEQAIKKGVQDQLPLKELSPQLLTRTLSHALARENLREKAFTDDLTALFNRRGFFTLAEQQLELAQRQHLSILLFIIDLDGLKMINDQEGHAAGDLALVTLADTLTGVFRSGDLIARIGGDEFAVLAIDCKHAASKGLITLIQERLERAKLSCSIGSAVWKGEAIDELMQRADRKLYQMKHHHFPFGRDERM